jgi:hypothetical protein
LHFLRRRRRPGRPRPAPFLCDVKARALLTERRRSFSHHRGRGITSQSAGAVVVLSIPGRSASLACRRADGVHRPRVGSPESSCWLLVLARSGIRRCTARALWFRWITRIPSTILTSVTWPALAISPLPGSRALPAESGAPDDGMHALDVFLPVSSIYGRADRLRFTFEFSALFAWLISHQPAVLFSQNKSATSNQPTVLFSQNKPAPVVSHQPNEQAGSSETGLVVVREFCKTGLDFLLLIMKMVSWY